MWDKSELSGDWIVNRLGVLQDDISASSMDDSVVIDIAKGTKVLDSTLNSLTEISVTPIASPAQAPGYRIIKSFNFAPDGAQFAPGITVTIVLNASDAADGEALVLGFYNEADDEWEFIEGTNNGDGTAAFTITHFSVYNLMYHEDTSEPIVPVQENEAHSNSRLIAIAAAVAAVLVIAIIILQLKRRRPARQQVRKNRKTAKTNRSDRWS